MEYGIYVICGLTFLAAYVSAGRGPVKPKAAPQKKARELRNEQQERVIPICH